MGTGNLVTGIQFKLLHEREPLMITINLQCITKELLLSSNSSINDDLLLNMAINGFNEIRFFYY